MHGIDSHMAIVSNRQRQKRVSARQRCDLGLFTQGQPYTKVLLSWISEARLGEQGTFQRAYNLTWVALALVFSLS